MSDRIKVLMVDDEEAFRTTTSKILCRRGFDTTVAGSGEEALQILRRDRHDVVILDVMMPGMDGHEALARIKELDPSIAVIMLTGHGSLDSARKSRDLRAFDYLAKPCDVDLLSARIHDAAMTGRGTTTRADDTGEKCVGDVMIPIEEYTTIDPDSSVAEAIVRLRRSFESQRFTSRILETGHRSILVFDHEKNLVGILSIMDLIRGLQPAYLSAPKPSTAQTVEFSPMFWTGLFTSQTRILLRKKVRDVMSDAPATISEDATLMEAAYRLLHEGVRRMVVVREGRVVGVLREQEVFFEIERIARDETGGGS